MLKAQKKVNLNYVMLHLAGKLSGILNQL